MTGASSINVSRYEKTKRWADIVLAWTALILTLPLWLIAAGIIVTASPGPIFFIQQRVGRWQRPFRLVKFRTMHTNDSSRAVAGDFVTIAGDPRIIRGGAWLRRWKIDELPQLLNVLTGSMSLVGPRPTVESDYARMTHSQRRRSIVPPGMTGLAQVRGGAAVRWPTRLMWDSRYIENRSLRLDAYILVETAWLILSGRTPGESETSDEWTEAERIAS
jgi:lipopolysaccharide/colanic/teichoic acid biosynthesis glycosyltransferase